MVALFDEANAAPLLLCAEQTALLQAAKLILLSEQIAKNAVSDLSISFRYYYSLTNAIFYYREIFFRNVRSEKCSNFRTLPF